MSETENPQGDPRDDWTAEDWAEEIAAVRFDEDWAER